MPCNISEIISYLLTITTSSYEDAVNRLLMALLYHKIFFSKVSVIAIFIIKFDMILGTNEIISYKKKSSYEVAAD